MNEQVTLQPKDFKSDQEVRWCAGCGDHAVLSAVHRAMAQTGIPREKIALISGIGCSSRFPYYMNTYAFHGIHGRAPAIASGVKMANPDLSVWVITGDGDALAIGGNHFIHVIRRNINLNIILLNNQIYGLTKGQYSPTSFQGQISKTSPFGTIEPPFHPGELTLGAQGNFFARSLDYNVKLTTDILVEAAKFQGTSVVEVLQNCVIYNDNAYGYINDKAYKEDRQLILEQGKPMIFGKNNDKGIIMEDMQLKVVKLGENGITEKNILIHDAKAQSPLIHWMLAKMNFPEFPVAFGVIRAVEEDTYSLKMKRQIEYIQKNSKIKNVDDLLKSGNTWEV
ncbi:MAG TPA: 2-oxoacid:ferredoxin oxidoreductase subunit beta [Bacteroidales bacterium]|jgi:2-oxoglutarate ferredoxin oxidoreductase subunit beta|nr:2-oxoacid:ferredoxin oxidoreductase subunit beta [Bacteroidales bacterium]MBP7874072.1 2-oxoacid:ferredoxin oxidoreductase subunit beta [Bacteroidales bacterium]MCZ2283637.1 2-oxoacid:ferredoxin oxidoreductase subunit beta [Bacteroidales bacterium]HNY59313.1 2-oxoacid:ferredoxin oxidoreductase subunit beta [Bacteroidales bacterium]HOG66385.1 2-oxoacid:ferredoxin oxidoreductase subunit beta [Bacteroidales bacterium]